LIANYGHSIDKINNNS